MLARRGQLSRVQNPYCSGDCSMSLQRPLTLLALLLLLSTGFTGCGTGPTNIDPNNGGASGTSFPQGALADLLNKPRAELVKQCEEMTVQVEIREKQHRDGSL